MNDQTETTNAAATTEKCAHCLFAIAEFVPDPNAPWVSGKQKPRIPAFRCHFSRPGTNGFPIVRGDEFCGMYTDKRTRKQPLVKLVMPYFAVAQGLQMRTRENGTGTGEA